MQAGGLHSTEMLLVLIYFLNLMGGTLNHPRYFHFTIEDQICLQKLLKVLLRAEHLHLLVI